MRFSIRDLLNTTLLVAVCCLPGCHQSTARNRVYESDTPENFEKNIKPLLAGIGAAKGFSLYEGLPHQGWEEELLAQELKSKKTVTLHQFPFYQKAITPTDEDNKKLKSICEDPKTFGRYRGLKLCGGYHPDWCIEWKDGKDVYQVLICFGCHEARVYGPKNDVYSDLDDDSLKKLIEILRAYRKNRPKKVKAE